jgi:hypothetical protein
VYELSGKDKKEERERGEGFRMRVTHQCTRDNCSSRSGKDVSAAKKDRGEKE